MTIKKNRTLYALQAYTRHACVYKRADILSIIKKYKENKQESFQNATKLNSDNNSHQNMVKLDSDDKKFTFWIKNINEEKAEILLDKYDDGTDYKVRKKQGVKPLKEILGDDPLFSQSHFTIFNDGEIISQFNQYIGGAITPVDSFLSSLQNTQKIHVKKLHRKEELDIFVRDIKEGTASLEIIDLGIFNEKYDISEINVKNPTLGFKFSNGSNLWERLCKLGNVVKLTRISNSRTKKQLKRKKDQHLRGVTKTVNYITSPADDDVFDNIDLFYSEINNLSDLFIFENNNLTVLVAGMDEASVL